MRALGLWGLVAPAGFVAVVAGCLSVQTSWGALPASWRQAGEDPVARAAVSRALAAERFRGGFGDMVPLANSLLEASRSASGEAALALAALAAEAAPQDPRPHARLLSLGLRGGRSPGSLLRDLWALAVAVATDAWMQLGTVLGLALISWAGSVFAALALGLAAAPACGPSLLHDYSDAFPKPIRRFTPAAFALLAAAALWGGGAGPGLLGAGLALALSAYLRPAARWGLGVSLGLACLLFPTLDWASRCAGPGGERAWALYRVAKGAAGPSVESALATGADASSPEVLEARSLLARRGGRYDEAISWLNAALAAGAGESPTRLEIGNLLFLQDRFAQAAAQYERAAAADPADPRPWLNLHVASLKRLALAEADRALDKARSLDSSSLSRLQQAQEGDAGTLLPVTAAPTGAWMRRAVWASTGPAAATWPTDLWQALVFPAPWLEPAFLGAAALLGAWILGTRGAQRLSRRCPSCGASVCPRCGRRVKGSDHCPACWSMLTQKGGDSAERARRQQLMAAWRLRAAFWRRVAAALVPGWGDFAFERSPWFLAVGVLWAGAAGAVVAHALYPAPWLPWGGPGFPWFGTLLVTCAHLYGLRRAMSRRPLPGRG